MAELHEQLGLTRWEHDRIRELQGRETTDVELAIFSLMRSERGGYKRVYESALPRALGE